MKKCRHGLMKKTCVDCSKKKLLESAKMAIGYAVEDGRVEANGYLGKGKVLFANKEYDMRKEKEVLKLANILEGMDYDPY